MEKKISDSELAVMSYLWENGPKTASEIIAALQKKKDWSSKTIRTMIDRLAAKEIIKVDRSQKELLFSPVITQKEYEKNTRKQLADRLYNGSIAQLLMNFVQQDELEKDEILELKSYLDELMNQR
ncbi:MAG: BlaI/MecI/CopY family transcriptional regulator [Erysipelotrichaceae bacterium]|nr:BlaI/MecI/CopY family transcriptional regulator [Erysipelotrichaceae bacterium]MBQ7888852.1 BlaI/MecI/CopY family transcriptional regulator [Erysipelotrichaceae bacterium]